MFLLSTPPPNDTVEENVEDNSVHRLITAVLYIDICLIGLAGNLLVIFSVILSKKLQTSTNVLVVSLSIADLITCSILPFQSTALLSNSGLPFHHVICSVIGVMLTVLPCCSVMTLTAIAFTRWYIITKPIRTHRCIGNTKGVIRLAIVIWVVSIIIATSPVAVDVRTYGHSNYYNWCFLGPASYDKKMLSWYVNILSSTVFIVCLTSTAAFYVSIFRFVRQNHRHFRSSFSDIKMLKRVESAETNNLKPRFDRRESEITKNLAIVFIAFCICVLPATASFVVPGRAAGNFYSTITFYANSAVNPLIYGWKHPTFQEEFRRILACRLPRRRRPTSVVV